MKFKVTGLVLALGMLLGLAALPATAALPGTHAGVFQAVADVGKDGECNNDGTGSVTGGSIGLLPTTIDGTPDVKNAWFTISNGTVVDAVSGLGTANLCGRLTAPLQDTVDGVDPKELGIGATCSATKGWGGYGKATFSGPGAKPNDVIWISDLGWKATLGGTFVVTGDAGGTKGADDGLLVAVVQALNDNIVLSCIQKSVDGNKADPDPFLVVATYAVTPAGGDANDSFDKGPKK